MQHNAADHADSLDDHTSAALIPDSAASFHKGCTQRRVSSVFIRMQNEIVLFNINHCFALSHKADAVCRKVSIDYG